MTIALLVVCAWWPGAARAEDVVEVSATGEGITPDAARDDALRKALEQGGRVEISSYSQVDNFVLIRDTIYSRADGIITDYKILEQGAGMGGLLRIQKPRRDPQSGSGGIRGPAGRRKPDQ